MCGTVESNDGGMPSQSSIIHCIFLSKMCAVVLCFRLPVECGPMEAAVCGELICRELNCTYLPN